MNANVAIVGAGFAGSEAAWQLSRRGWRVDLHEMRPQRMTEAHRGGDCAELVCSNSFKSLRLENAHGLLKAEMGVQGSLVLEVAREAAVPAGQALAVDREVFSRLLTARLGALPNVTLRREEVTALAPLLEAYRLVIVASGPLTSSALAADLSRRLGTDYLYFHDAIAPVVTTDSIDMAIAFRASRRGDGSETGDYINCPLDKVQYLAFVAEVKRAEKVAFHDFESLRPFEGCLPIEVMAERGDMTLAFGPMKPVGLEDPRTGRRPYAVVQLRQENRQGTLYGMVGFQTKMTWPEQRRVLRMIPGLERAEFARLGSLHRNTFIHSPRLLDADLALRSDPRIRFAGQITGVEGYMESTSVGLYAGQRAAAALAGRARPRPSGDTMIGALVRYVTETPDRNFQPMNSAFGLLNPLPDTVQRGNRKAAYAARALAEIERLEREESVASAAAG
jgi:methylenetetrahydrofolate--tRNA-(uracil-5-)-methyltransferase